MAMIPAKNSSALVGYYLGVFSLIPFIGIPLGILAIIFGTKGLHAANALPDHQGKGHALTAIILGFVGTFGYAFLVFVLISWRS